MNSSVKYYDDSWSIGENYFNKEWLGKYETILAQGNGYMGIRAATEENYIGETRDTFVAGTFNKFDEKEVTELPNVPDFIQMQLRVNGELLDLTTGETKQYERRLNLQTGELTRTFIWVSPKGTEVEWKFSRFVSKKRLHIIGQKMEVKALNEAAAVEIISGIDGRMTNSGSQHFHEGEKRLKGKDTMQMTSTTLQSNIDFILTTAHQFKLNAESRPLRSRIEMPRRKVENLYWATIEKGETLTIEKISSIHTTRDKEHINHPTEEIEELAVAELKKVKEMGYDSLAQESHKEWEKPVWQVAPIQIESPDPLDQLAINFARYHLHCMTPAHDERMNIGAKGLTGEGYKGHTFWDTEIFVLPYFTFTHPDIAKSLVEYRYHGLEGAHKKASGNDYEGAQYPWEAAWIEDGETTPVWGAADIVTGKATKIWSGFIEQHITGDVAYGVYQYNQATQDQTFMDEKGYEILLDTAKFWTSRVEYGESKDQYGIKGVIGPDEYKEHVDNNAFTNYIARWNMEKALEVMEELKTRPTVKKRLDEQFDLADLADKLKATLAKLFVPQPNEDGIIPQDDTYLTKEVIDLTKYKAQDFVGGLFHDYNLERVNDMQITKQADVLLLLYLFEDQFEKDTKDKNWNYYEPKTMHDSSLSLSTHTTLAADLGYAERAYELFKKARFIDMGPVMTTSNEGIHAASLGGIWQAVVFGFGGVRSLNGELRIEPSLPNEWTGLTYSIYWHGNEIEVSIDKEQMTLTNKTQTEAIEFESFGKQYTVLDKTTVLLTK
ncbi:glycoside hydrolase family 65 protein [Lacticigenium naphthae]|uniref:glycoside hydrolase family 65 protein n=1 Tax=Lacticigenium naphthae TaxID=515351 RepID=UPI0003F9BC67|nr:glycosyl hydrolase family 65 protein [Lacticigenium naphthae]